MAFKPSKVLEKWFFFYFLFHNHVLFNYVKKHNFLTLLSRSNDFLKMMLHD